MAINLKTFEFKRDRSIIELGSENDKLTKHDYVGALTIVPDDYDPRGRGLKQ